nr:flavodoxin-dependent (E)-4-hydroxy-3-methylbut-2-enyl-diphosphate synthase [Nitrospiraceae bacterium]
DTMRVSLTGDPVDEIRVGFEILKSLGLRQRGINFVSCPTCGRTTIDIEKLATMAEKKLRGLRLLRPVKVAVMGCVVNGPGEAKEADFGITGAKGMGMLFKKGKLLRTVKEDELLKELIKEVGKWKP